MRAAASRSSAPRAGAKKPPAAPREAAPAHLEIRIWLRLLGCANRIEAALQRRLVAAHGVTLARFDLLAQLERAGGVLTMTEASRRMMVTNGAVTGLVDRLTDEGFVAREPHPDDRRATLVRLTGDGRTRFLAMAREHEAWTAALLAGLPAADKKQLLANLDALKRTLDRAEPAA